MSIPNGGMEYRFAEHGRRIGRVEEKVEGVRESLARISADVAVLENESHTQTEDLKSLKRWIVGACIVLIGAGGSLVATLIAYLAHA